MWGYEINKDGILGLVVGEGVSWRSPLSVPGNITRGIGPIHDNISERSPEGKSSEMIGRKYNDGDVTS